MVKTIRQTYSINAPAEKVWLALVDAKAIDNWGAGPAKMSKKEGVEFFLWGGDIHGKNIEVIPKKKLVQEWMAGSWDKYSKVTFVLSEKEGKTHVVLIHKDVPDKEVIEIEDGWKQCYMEPLKEYVERGR